MSTGGISSFGFGDEASEADVADFESETAGGNGHADDSKPRDDHSDDAGWDQTTDVKSIEGAGKEPDDDEGGDKGTGVRKDGQGDDDKAKDKAKEPDKKDGDGDDDGEGDDDADKGDDLPEGVKRRVARANRARDRERERAEAAEKEAAELRKQLEAKPKADDAVAPKAEDFDDYEDYLQAKKDFEAKPKPDDKAKDKPADDGKPKPDAELVGAVKEIEASLLDAGHGDLFKQVVAKADIDVTRDMAIAIADLDNPESVLQAFLDDPAKSKAIADLKTPTARLKALLKLDVPYVKPDKKADDDAGKDKAKDKPAPKKGSDAPDPIDGTNGNAHADAGYDGLSFSEFEKKRNSEERASKDFW